MYNEYDDDDIPLELDISPNVYTGTLDVDYGKHLAS